MSFFDDGTSIRATISHHIVRALDDFFFSIFLSPLNIKMSRSQSFRVVVNLMHPLREVPRFPIEKGHCYQVTEISERNEELLPFCTRKLAFCAFVEGECTTFFPQNEENEAQQQHLRSFTIQKDNQPSLPREFNHATLSLKIAHSSNSFFGLRVQSLPHNWIANDGNALNLVVLSSYGFSKSLDIVIWS